MSDSPWFVSRPTSSRAPYLVYCFPHAGGNARSFLSWQQHLAADAELVGVCAPGRGLRLDEPSPAGIAELAEGAARAIAAAADRPFLLFGHSFGAVLAFETARRLRELPLLRHLVASGCAAPRLLPSERVRQTAKLRGQEFTEAVAFFGGLPPEVLAEPELQDLLLPGLRADFHLVSGYRYQPGEPLPIGISLVNGREDPHVGPAELRHWEHESVLPLRYHWADGGHFYFGPDPAPAVDLLRSLIRADSSAPGAREEHVELI
ncbi:thioesterase II family protein [Kitasatospora sp. NPDC001683]